MASGENMSQGLKRSSTSQLNKYHNILGKM